MCVGDEEGRKFERCGSSLNISLLPRKALGKVFRLRRDSMKAGYGKFRGLPKEPIEFENKITKLYWLFRQSPKPTDIQLKINIREWSEFDISVGAFRKAIWRDRSFFKPLLNERSSSPLNHLLTAVPTHTNTINTTSIVFFTHKHIHHAAERKERPHC